MFYAHSRENQPEETWEPLIRHLRDVAQQASIFTQPFGTAGPPPMGWGHGRVKGVT